VEASTEFGAPQGDDGVGPADGPTHPRSFESCPDDTLAAGLDHAGASANSLRLKLGILHPFSVAVQVLETLAGLVAVIGVPTNRSQQIGKATGVQLLVAPLSPDLGLPSLSAVDELSQFTEVFFDVEAVYDLDGAGKQFLSDLPSTSK